VSGKGDSKISAWSRGAISPAVSCVHSLSVMSLHPWARLRGEEDASTARNEGTQTGLSTQGAWRGSHSAVVVVNAGMVN
jgi:hypothetical protein